MAVVLLLRLPTVVVISDSSAKKSRLCLDHTNARHNFARHMCRSAV